MKKLLTMLFAAVLCPVLVQQGFAFQSPEKMEENVKASITNKSVISDKEMAKMVKDGSYKGWGIIVSDPVSVDNVEYTTQTRVIPPGDDDWAEGLEGERNEPQDKWWEPVKRKTNNFNRVLVNVKANDSIMEQMYIDSYSNEIYFNIIHDYLVIKDKQNDDEIFIAKDYKVGVFDLHGTPNLSNGMEGKYLELSIIYAPKYFGFKKVEYKAGEEEPEVSDKYSVNPFLHFQEGNKITDLYLVPTDALIEDFKDVEN